MELPTILVSHTPANNPIDTHRQTNMYISLSQAKSLKSFEPSPFAVIESGVLFKKKQTECGFVCFVNCTYIEYI